MYRNNFHAVTASWRDVFRDSKILLLLFLSVSTMCFFFALSRVKPTHALSERIEIRDQLLLGLLFFQTDLFVFPNKSTSDIREKRFRSKVIRYHENIVLRNSSDNSDMYHIVNVCEVSQAEEKNPEQSCQIVEHTFVDRYEQNSSC